MRLVFQTAHAAFVWHVRQRTQRVFVESHGVLYCGSMGLYHNTIYLLGVSDAHGRFLR